jgi:HEAT repeat protein
VEAQTPLRHPDKNVRIQEALTIGERQDVSALHDLVRGLRDDPDFFVRETISWALMRLGDPAVDPLVELTRDPEARVRHDAIHALSKVGYDRAALPVWERLWDDDWVVIAKAAYTLGVFGERGAAPELADLLMHEQPEVRTAAVEALERLGHLAFDALSQVLVAGTPEGRRRAADVLGSIEDPRAIEPLVIALEDPDWNVRVSALMALSGLDDQRATAAVAAASNDPDPRVQALAKRLTRDE